MRRAFTLALLLFEAMFFNVVLPGHTRGMIQLPGSSCCEPACCAAKHPGSKQSPCDNERTSNCALCAFAARITIPPAVDFAPPPTGLLEILPPPVAQTFEVASFPRPFFGRAPPALHV
jgi:hypothetical protein